MQVLKPRVSPDGWTSLRDATHFVAMALAGGRNALCDLDAAINAGDFGPVAVPQSVFADWIKASPAPGRKESMVAIASVDFLRRAALTGAMKSAYSAKGAGEILPMPLAAWRTDDHWLRFQGYSFDPDNWGATGSELPCWVFLESEAVQQAIEGLRMWVHQLPDVDEDGEGNGWFREAGASWPVNFSYGCIRGGVRPPAFQKLAVVSGLAAANDRHPSSHYEKDSRLFEEIRRLMNQGVSRWGAVGQVAPNEGIDPESTRKRIERHFKEWLSNGCPSVSNPEGR